MHRFLSAILLLAPFWAAAQPDTRGREFWLGFMQNASGTQQISVRIAAEQATTGTVEVPLAGWSTAFSVPANGVVSVAVPNIYEVTGSESVLDRGVHITSVEPVTVTAVNYQNQTTDATQVLPITALGTSYRVDALEGTATAYQNGTYIFRSEFMVVATEDGTEVTITPTATTTAGHAPGVPFTVSLNAGQTYQVQALSGLTDLSGTTVVGTAQSGPCRPFAVFGGSMCAVVSCAACDHVNEQMEPVNTWGNAFHTVRLGNLSAWGYRILANENNTLVTIDGGSPVLLQAGQLHTVLNTTQPACINSSKPVSVSQLMQGATCAGTGDPSLLLLQADDRMSTSARFTTLTSTQANVYHYVSLVTHTGAISQLLLDGVPLSASLFSTYPGCAGLSQAKVQVSPGTHSISSPAGFLAYAYGVASGESYLYGVSNRMAEPMDPDTVICSNGSITLTAPIVLSNAQWTTASDPGTVLATGNSYTFTPDHNDVYRVDGVILPSGCPKHFEFQVGLPVEPQLNLTANGLPAASVCQFSSVQLGTGSVLDPQWFDLHWSPSTQVSDPAIPDPVAYPIQDTWYKLMVTSPVGCGSAVDSVLVTVQTSNIFALRTTTADDSICAGGITPLHAEVERVLYSDAFEGSAGTWWGSISGGSPDAACGSVTGQALYFNGGGTRSATSPPVDFSNGGMVHFALKIGAGAAPCDDAEPGEDVVLEYSTDGSTWNLLATFAEHAYPAFTQVDAAIPPLGPSGASTRLRWRQPLHSGAGQDNWSLDNLLITRYEDPTGQLSWTPGAALDNAQSATPAATPTGDTWFHAQVTGTSGCTYADSVLVHVAPAFTILPINDTTRCGIAGTQLQAQVSSGTGIQWSWLPATGLSSASVANPVASPSATTSYTVQATNSWGCMDDEQVTVAVSGLSTVAATASDQDLCHGESVNLASNVASTGAYSIAWTPAALVQDPASGATISDPVDTTTFICTATDAATGCTVSSAITVNVNPAYQLNMPADTTVCSALGHQLLISHNMAAPYQISWSPADQLNSGSILSPTILADTTTTYEVTLTDQSGCSVTGSTTVSVAFDNLITPVNVGACAGETLVLDAGFPGSTYAWNTNASTQSIAVTQPGQYTATITDANLCQAIKTFNVTFHPLPVVDLGPDLALCGQTSHVLDAGNAGSTILWNTGAVGSQLTVTATGTYSVTVSNANGCETSDAVHIALNPLPTDALQDITACEEQPPTLHAGNPGSTYAWSNGGTGESITPTASGTYSVAVTTAQNCTATFDAVVTLMPRVDVDLGPDMEHCEGDPVQLMAGPANLTYTWNTGATTPTLAPTASGSYSVTASNGYCSDADTVAVVIHPAPANLLTDRTECTGETIAWDAGNPGSDFVWSTGEHTQGISVTTAGTYSVTITTPEGCTATYAAAATFVAPPAVDLGADTVLCAGQLLILDAGNPGCTYLWSTGATSRTVPVGTGGQYSVAAENGFCSASDEVTVHFNPAPAKMPVHQFFTCLDEMPHSVEVDAGNAGATFLWDDGRTTQTIQATSYGWHIVTITNAFGCSLTDSALVNEFCSPTLFVPNTFTPNGDGRNDTWTAVGNNIVEYEMTVFDRWGGVLFRSTDVNVAWDGTLGGEPVPNDIYAFRVIYRLQENSSGKLGFEQTKLGHVQVLR